MSDKVKAAIFDVDGTLLDSREWIYQAYEHTFTQFDQPIPSRETIAEQMGKTLKDCYRILAPDSDNESMRKIHREFQQANIELISPYLGLVDMLDELAGKVKLAAVSSRYGSVMRTLRNAGVDCYFEVVVQGDEVQSHKPHPESLLKALGALSINPYLASMAGDSVEDIHAGKAANVSYTIAVTHGFGTLDRLQNAEPDYLVDSLSVIAPIILGKNS